MLATHRQGVSADRLGELVYGEADAVGTVTLRAEMVRLRKVLEKAAPALVPESRPYRLAAELETDAQQVLSLLDRGAHRVALAAYRGDVLPDSTAPGVEQFRDTVRTALREALIAEASVDVLLDVRRDGCRRRRRGAAAALPQDAPGALAQAGRAGVAHRAPRSLRLT